MQVFELKNMDTLQRCAQNQLESASSSVRWCHISLVVLNWDVLATWMNTWRKGGYYKYHDWFKPYLFGWQLPYRISSDKPSKSLVNAAACCVDWSLGP